MTTNCLDLAKGQEQVPIPAEESVSEALETNAFQPVVSEENMATVIRVKRKRSAEPAEALLLACKKSKRDENFKGNSGMADIIQIEEKVFHFATTVASNSPMDHAVKEKVKNAILLRNKLRTIYNKSDRKQAEKHQLDKKCPEVAKNKFKFVGLPSKHAVGAQETSAPPPKDPYSRRASAPVSSNLLVKSHRHWKSNLTNKNHQSHKQLSPLLDIEEEMMKAKTPSRSEEILCNSVKMLREKLHVSTPKGKDDYVYDLYYCQKTADSWNVQDILYVKPCKDLDFVYEEPQHDSHKYDDEDDSNDETNWRNDYPDEEDSMDDDERRLMFEEEEDRYESDDCDLSARDDECDAYSSLYGASNYDDLGYDDDYQNEPSYGNYDDYNTNEPESFGNDDVY